MKKRVEVVVIDGQGGRIGRSIVEECKKRFEDLSITAIGTNSIATANMVKGGASCGATGENPVIVACRKADIIVGPIGMVVADSLVGEVTPKMAVAVGQSDAQKVLIPMNRCSNHIVGVKEMSTGELIAEAIHLIQEIYEQLTE